MLLQALNILNLPIASLDTNEKIGKIGGVIVDVKSLNIIGFIIQKTSFFWAKKYYVSSVDVLDLDTNGLVVQNEKKVIDPEEVVRANKIIKQRFSLFRLPAETRNHQKLGKIDDFVIDTNTLSVTSFYLTGFLESKIIETKNVYKVTKNKIIFENDVFEKNLNQQELTI